MNRVIFFSFLLVFLTGCFLPSFNEGYSAPSSSNDPLEKSEIHLENSQPKKALQELKLFIQKNPKNARAYYLKGSAHGLLGEVEKSIFAYEKALEILPNYHDAYIVLQGIYQLKQTQIQEKIDRSKEQKERFINSGEGNLSEILKELEQNQLQQIKMDLGRAKVFILYLSSKESITEFPELDADLRDAQEFLKEKIQSQKEIFSAQETLQQVTKMRSAIIKKHIGNLILLADTYANNRNLNQAIDALKEADSQIGKFFTKEEAKIQSLAQDKETLVLSQEILKRLIKLYQDFLKIHLKNRKEFTRLGKTQEAQDENKRLEQGGEMLVQLQITSLWRLQQTDKIGAETDPSLIPLYENLILIIPDSVKVGDYHLKLAYCYYNQKDYKKTRYHLDIAKKTLGSYKTRELARKLLGK